jgi:dihydrofolate reductase
MTQQSQDQEEIRRMWERKMQEEMHRRQQEQNELQRQVARAAYWAQKTQQEINNTKRQKYAAIVAVDERGGFSKNGQIPWHYPEDFKWFQTQTKGHICVMGRTTYDDINKRLGEKAAESVLPGRRCFVVTSSPLPRENAIAVASISDVDKHLTFEDADNDRIVFFCGGERIYREGIAKCNTVYVTVVNKDVDADKFFPTSYLTKHFTQDKMFKADSAPDLRFTIWKRNS